MTSRAWAVAACGLALLLGACRGGLSALGGPRREAARPGGVTAGVEWAVLPVARAPEFGLDADSYWEPADDHVRAALERVGSRLVLHALDDERATGVAARLEEYRCQAVGFVRAGRRHLHLNFFRRGDVEDEGLDWTREPLVVLDGGEAFWQVDYDPESGVLHDLSVNGEA